MLHQCRSMTRQMQIRPRARFFSADGFFFFSFHLSVHQVPQMMQSRRFSAPGDPCGSIQRGARASCGCPASNVHWTCTRLPIGWHAECKVRAEPLPVTGEHIPANGPNSPTDTCLASCPDVSIASLIRIPRVSRSLVQTVTEMQYIFRTQLKKKSKIKNLNVCSCNPTPIAHPRISFARDAPPRIGSGLVGPGWRNV